MNLTYFRPTKREIWKKK